VIDEEKWRGIVLRYCTVAPTEEEEEEVYYITIHNYISLLQYAKPEADNAVLGF
jgi:hypothetical protein